MTRTTQDQEPFISVVGFGPFQDGESQQAQRVLGRDRKLADLEAKLASEHGSKGFNSRRGPEVNLLLLHQEYIDIAAATGCWPSWMFVWLPV